MASPAAATPQRMAHDDQQRAAGHERVYAEPARQADLRAMEAWLPGIFAARRVLEIATGTGWWMPQGAAQAIAALGLRAKDAQRVDWRHAWALRATPA